MILLCSHHQSLHGDSSLSLLAVHAHFHTSMTFYERNMQSCTSVCVCGGGGGGGERIYKY